MKWGFDSSYAHLMENLRTSDKWQEEFPTPRVMDPDGWDRKNYQYSWFEELISEQEYKKRVCSSTCMNAYQGFKRKA